MTCCCGHPRVCHQTNHRMGPCWYMARCPCLVFAPVLALLPPAPPLPPEEPQP